MIAIRPVMWRWTLTLIFLAGFGVALCALLLVILRGQVNRNEALIKDNSALITQLQARDRALAATVEEARVRESGLQLLVRGLQAQVAALGGDPLQLPPELRTAPASPATTAPGRPAPASTPAAQRPAAPSRPARSASPRAVPRPTSTPRPQPSPSPSCLVSVGQVCLPRLS